MSDGRVFIANSFADHEAAERVEEQLRDVGLSTWRADDIQIGTDFALSITTELGRAGAILVLVSPHSRGSEWIRFEIEYASRARIPIFPVLIEGQPEETLDHVQHALLGPDGRLSTDQLVAIKSQVRAPRSRSEVGSAAGAVLEALESRTLGEVIGHLQEVMVLVLGNFSDANKRRLMLIKSELEAAGLAPVIFDFERSRASDFGETVRILAGLTSFVIADMSDPRSVVVELQLLAPDTAVPIITLHHRDDRPVALFSDLLKYDWVLEPIAYGSDDDLPGLLHEVIIERARSKRAELIERKRAAATAMMWPSA
jgi:hypothetical protein